MKRKEIHTQPLLNLPARRFAYPNQAVFLSQAALLEEVGPPKIPAIACFLGFVLVVVAILASALIKIDIISSSTGRITSSTANHQLQSFDGGIVDEIHVKEGQIVDAGELMLTLNDPEAEAQLSRFVARHASLSARAKRMRQLAELDQARGGVVEPTSNVFELQQMTILPLEEAAAASERSLIRAEIYRRVKSLENLRSMKKNITMKLKLANEELTSHKHLYQKNIVNKSTLIQLKKEVNDISLSLKEIEGRIGETELTIVESTRRLEDVIASRRQKQGDQLSSIMVDLSELDQQIISLRARIDRGLLRAPIRGIIHELSADFSGQIIAPGDKLLEMIPMDSELVMEGRLPPEEISHVSKEQKVRIAVDGIEPHRVGYLEGEVKHLSPSTFVDENGMPYYQVLAILNGKKLAGIPLIPGMTVQAQIKTGERTILEYLLKPIYRAWNTAFSEH